MDKLYDLKDKLCQELEEIARKPDMGAGDLEVLHKLTDTIKNIDKICLLEEEGGYSEAVDGGDYGRGSSYANRGRHYVRGHYSRDGENGMVRRRDGWVRYSREDGRSEMLAHIERALDSADERDREKLKRLLRELENA